MSEARHTSETYKPLLEHPLRTVWVLAWPAVALNSLQTFNSLLDNFFLSYVGDKALAAVGASTSYVFMLFSISFAIGTAATAIVSRAFGAGEHSQTVTANSKCLSLAIWLGIALALLAYPGAIGAAHLLVPTNERETIRLFIVYGSIFAAALPAVFVIQTLAGSLRGIGDTRSPMFISGLQIVLHVTLNTLLVLPTRQVGPITIPGAGMGLAGAATAMAVSSWVSAGIYIYWSRHTPLGTKYDFRLPDFGWIKRILRIAVPASVNRLVRVTSLGAFTIVLKNTVDAVHAQGALRPGFSIESFAFMPSFGLSIAAAALVGQSLGMDDSRRAERLGWTAAHQAGAVSLVVSVLLFVFADPLSRAVLPGDLATAAVAAQYTRYIASTEVFFAYAMVLIQAMQGAGDTRRPLWISLGTLWGVRVPAAALLALPMVSFFGLFNIAGWNMGADGAWLSMAGSQVVQGIAAMIVFKQGKWKLTQV
ncbi:MAG TPA: MATE family efflux transporter [Fimbriimonadaceae bacterium]|nr:MATE family efflux transporter [Fimbriimonadaceae bacterium]